MCYRIRSGVLFISRKGLKVQQKFGGAIGDESEISINKNSGGSGSDNCLGIFCLSFDVWFRRGNVA